MRAGKSLAVAMVAALIGLGLMLAPATRAASAPLKIRAAWIATPASLIPILFAKAGLAKHNGTSYEFVPMYFSSSPTQITALASGDLEIGTLNFTSFPFAILNAGLDLRIIADDTEDGFDDYVSIQYKVRRDAGIKTVKHLKGRALGIIGIGAATDIAMRTFLRRGGLNYPGDYTLVEVRPPNAKAMLLEQKVDLITAGLPFAYDPELVANSQTLFTMKDALGASALSFWVVRSDFLTQHRAVLVDLLEDTVRSYRWFADPANHKEACEILARFTKQPVERVEGWAFTKKDAYRDPNGLPNIDMIAHDVDAMKELGFIKADLSIKRYADTSLVKEADRRFK
jgi:NitT/TauT family transport system substrate-binding protein